ncbi:hypothetical protein [Streptomyces daliensis]|uniref:Uncharacterized protein n=1 Tax=Streptomyces daliensis TaxID=299421 RepID=A0A8T4J2Z5_9ACTN|nr:hypothetical protein [Streptomyces daliensis]
MNLHMSIVFPSEQLSLTPDFDLTSDYEVLVMDVCELLSETDCRFVMGGFGQDPWPVDVSYDLSSVMEQLPTAISDLRRRGEAVIDLYGQGVQRRLTFAPTGDLVNIRCSSDTRWQPDPAAEQVSYEEALRLLEGLKKDFRAAVERTSPTVAAAGPFAEW